MIPIGLEEEKRTISITEKIMKKVKIMGVLNITPDSFYDGDKDLLVNQKKLSDKMISLAGSDIIDVGCESSRPNAKPISEKEEILPAQPMLCKRVFSIPIDFFLHFCGCIIPISLFVFML